MTTAVATLTMSSTAFSSGKAIPTKYTGEGENISPPLSWADAPPEAKQFALIVDDPDAPTAQPFVHWVLCGIPAGTTSLAEGASSAKGKKSPAGMTEGKNDYDVVGYKGPMPPAGAPHRYYFRLYALDKALELRPGVTRVQLVNAMQGHIICQGELMGTFKR